MSQDTIANLLSSLKNAYIAGKREANLPFSKPNLTLVKILVAEGYLAEVSKISTQDGHEQLGVRLNSSKDGKVIGNIRRLSRPGIRLYSSAQDLRPSNRRLGIVIVSTSKGLMTSREAVKKNLGGELVCRIW
jgi:small subunit ribosomal protein S8